MDNCSSAAAGLSRNQAACAFFARHGLSSRRTAGRSPLSICPLCLRGPFSTLPPVRWTQFAVLLLCLAVAGLNARAASAKVIKVLPHYLDKEGRHAISPSLYDRDAYQARLRQTPQERSGLRFDVQWKSRETGGLKLRVELRGLVGNEPTTALLENEVEYTALFSKWSSVAFQGDAYKKFGELSAWRTTLWKEGQLLAEQKSFLW